MTNTHPSTFSFCFTTLKLLTTEARREIKLNFSLFKSCFWWEKKINFGNNINPIPGEHWTQKHRKSWILYCECCCFYFFIDQKIPKLCFVNESSLQAIINTLCPVWHWVKTLFRVFLVFSNMNMTINKEWKFKQLKLFEKY